MRRAATALSAAGVLVALIVPASAGAAYAPAGGWGGLGAGNGQLNAPHGIATDSAGNVYVADAGNNRIQKFNAAGEFLSKSSLALNLTQVQPRDVAVGPGGSVFAAGPNGVDVFSGALSVPLAHWDSPGAYGIAVDGAGNVYVGDQQSKQIHKYGPGGSLISSWGGEGGAPGQFSTPYGLTTDSGGNVYVADPGNGRVQKFNSAGDFLAQWTMPSYTIGSIQGVVDPRDVAVDGVGRVSVPDAGTHSNLVAVFAADGTLQQIFGTPDGSPSDACALDTPRGISTSASGALYVADTGNDAIKIFGESAGTPCPTPSLTSVNPPPTGGGPPAGSSRAGGGPDTRGPGIRVSGFPTKKKCARKNFVILIQLLDEGLIDRFFLSLNGRPAASDTVGQPHWLLRVTMPVSKVRRQIPRGVEYPVKMKIRVTDTAGNQSKAKLKFRICGAG